MKSLALATNNPHKVREIKAILEPLGFEVKTPKELRISFGPDETGSTFQENAFIKAKDLHKQSGLLSLADDSGICVDALEGKPGVNSAIYGGDGLNDEGRARLLLHEIQGKEDRSAKYVCVMALVGPDLEVSFEGECKGKIAEDYDQTGHGFGYDPIFYYPPFQARFSQVPESRKNEVSHRKIALDKLVHYLINF
ncbi:non-canonical purine NTP pyrophosphatase, RdgB/HAM1 family [Leptospira perolatii]|uniref:dITP/XTP pyrophosphatase n=1 Tax=Leptospira perolatii TaxID=2023191 RepID=A0A2M9ZSI0_9LEPT|nr:RdgB/HAM1 family non-canonical purine NTP pyrophosphatase [Leptospira perolatii]PJZ71395.1 non-canonical purine NTP pyrophosphatase, RdgB/HAM1 family [Leptospira perolatii]PJZ74929.1 non-canonical purine NTP pyrophosphatase, RdgB/HAM1 family [Leptospira perolatii]